MRRDETGGASSKKEEVINVFTTLPESSDHLAKLGLNRMIILTLYGPVLLSGNIHF